MFNRKKYDREYYIENKDKKKLYKKKWYQDNHERLKEKFKQWRENNPEYIKEWRKNNAKHIKKYNEKWKDKNRERIREYDEQWHKNNSEKSKIIKNRYIRNRRKRDLKFNLDCRMKCAIWKSLKNYKAGKHWEDLVGYTLTDLIKRLKLTLPRSYTWQDYIEGKLHIDHIIPKSAFNYIKPEHTDFKRCWALSNLRLLSKEENLKKSNRLNKPFQLALQI